jgi:arylsulfatase A
LLERKQAGRRTTLINHSNHGEFAYRDGPWKLVYKLSGRNLRESRGKPTIAELYNLSTDVGEKNDLFEQRPEVARKMIEGLRALIERGVSRAGIESSNDTSVRFETTQTKRWGG